eukprot:360947-Chlamydomonas_euryale.AAC.3
MLLGALGIGGRPVGHRLGQRANEGPYFTGSVLEWWNAQRSYWVGRSCHGREQGCKKMSQRRANTQRRKGGGEDAASTCERQRSFTWSAVFDSIEGKLHQWRVGSEVKDKLINGWMDGRMDG